MNKLAVVINVKYHFCLSKTKIQFYLCRNVTFLFVGFSTYPILILLMYFCTVLSVLLTLLLFIFYGFSTWPINITLVYLYDL